MIKLPAYREGRSIYDATGWSIMEITIEESKIKDMDYIVDAINNYDTLKKKVEELEDEIENERYEYENLHEQMDC